MIELREISVSFGDNRVLERLSDRWPDCGTVVLRGPSGSGKTTLLRVLCGLLRPDAGCVTGLKRRRVSVVFQEDRLLPWRTALENVALVSDERTARELLARLDLAQAMDGRPDALSGGMRRRVAMARALAYSDDVLLLDEPFTGLDAVRRDAAAALIRERAKLIVVATHDEAEAALLGATHWLTLPAQAAPPDAACP